VDNHTSSALDSANHGVLHPQGQLSTRSRIRNHSETRRKPSARFIPRNNVHRSPVAPASVATASPVNIDIFMKTIEEIRRTSARMPQWVDMIDAVAVFGVPVKTIKLWAHNGFVRNAKLGPTLQSKALYNAADINDCLCRIAGGKQPLNALKKVE